MKSLLEQLRLRDDDICKLAAQEIERLHIEIEHLRKENKELSYSYEKMGNDLMALYTKYEKLKHNGSD